MRKYSLIVKNLSLGIILLFIVLTIAPSINANMRTSTSYFTENLGTLSGYVTDSSMNPIEGARVRVYFHEEYRENYSSSTGYYHVTDIPICYCMKNTTCVKEGYYPEWVLLSIAENTTYDFVLTPLNQSEIEPPSGPTEGFVNESYTFYFVIPDDLNSDEYFILWNWGDGSQSGWLGPYVSDQITTASHIWTDAGVYEIRVKLRNTNGTENNWSDPHIIEIKPYRLPRFEITFNGPNILIRNSGDAIATNVQVRRYLDGGVIILGKDKTVSFSSIIIGETKEAKMGWIFGLGATKITISVSCDEGVNESSSHYATILLFFIMILS